MSPGCNKCNTDKCPKADLVKEKESEIRRILGSYKKDKSFYRKVIGGSFLLNALTLAFGKQGLTMFIELMKDLWPF